MRIRLFQALGPLLVVPFLLVPGFGDTINFGLATSAGDNGTSHVYTIGSTTLTATAGAGGHLYAKQDGGDENGIGLTGDPTGNHEIWRWNSNGTLASPVPFIELDISNLLKAGYTNLQFTMGSTTAGESWAVYACSGALHTGSCGPALTGFDEGYHNLPGDASHPYISFYDTSGVNTGGKNVLLDGLSYTAPTPTPEPASLMMLGSGLVAVGGFFRRRTKPLS